MNYDSIRKHVVKLWRFTTELLVSPNLSKGSQTDRPGQRGDRKNRLVSGAIGSFGLKIVSTSLGFVTSILLARLLGASGFGIYAYVMAWATLLSIPATLGLDQLMVREVAIYQTQSAWGLINGFLQWANQKVLQVSLVMSLITFGIAWGLGIGNHPHMLLAFGLAMVSLPITCLRKLRIAAMKALDHFIIGQLPEMLFAPFLLLLLIGCSYVVLGSGLTPAWVVAMYVLASAISLWIGFRLLDQVLPNAVREAEPEYQVETWVRSGLPFILLMGIFVIYSRTDLIMLGMFKDADQVGVYAVVIRAIQLINFVPLSVNGVIAPTIASLYAQGKVKNIPKLIVQNYLIVLAISLLLIVSLIVFSDWYFLAFGDNFTAGKKALNIICIGQIVKSAMGWTHVVLNMIREERLTSIFIVFGTLLNIILNAWLIPDYGINGAAYGTTISVVFIHFIMLILAIKKMNNMSV